MELRYGIIDENVRKRSMRDVILHERLDFKRKPARADQFFKKEESQRLQEVISGQTSCQKKTYTAAAVSSALCGELAVFSAVNGLSAQGFLPLSFSPLILFPAGTKENVLREVMRQICRSAFPLGIEVEEGQMEVTDAVTRPVVIGTAEGVPFSCLCSPEKADGAGERHVCRKKDILSERNAGKSNIEKRDAEKREKDIVMAGSAGLEGTYILASLYREQLCGRFPESLVHRALGLRQDLSIVRAAKTVFAAVKVIESRQPKQDPMTLVNLSDGGVLAGLWALCAKTGCGMEVFLKEIPILQETIEITELFGIDPYSMRSGGGLLIAAENGRVITEALLKEGIPAVQIGRLTGTNDRILRSGEDVRYLDRPGTDALAEFFYKKREFP